MNDYVDYNLDSVPRTIIQEELSALMRKVIDNHVAAGQMASGKTAKSLRVEVEGDEGRLVGKSFFGVLETGRKPGRVPRNFAAIIRKWMDDKRIQAEPIPYKTDRPHKYNSAQERGNWSMAHAIAHTIAKKGTLQFRIGERSDIYSKEIDITKKRVAVRMGAFVTALMKNIKLHLKETSK